MDNSISALERMYQRTRTLSAQEDAHNDNDHIIISIALNEAQKLKAELKEAQDVMLKLIGGDTDDLSGVAGYLVKYDVAGKRARDRQEKRVEG